MWERLSRLLFAHAYRIVYALCPEGVMPLIVPTHTAEKILLPWPGLTKEELSLVGKQVLLEQTKRRERNDNGKRVHGSHAEEHDLSGGA